MNLIAKLLKPMKIKMSEKMIFVAVLLLLFLFPLVSAESAKVALTITLEMTPPEVTITNPVNNTNINILNNTVSGTVTDNVEISQVSLSLNGNVVHTWSSAGAFSKVVNYTANSTAVIIITANDTSNNIASETIIVNVLPNTVSRTVTTTANMAETIDAKNETGTIINLTTVQDMAGSINVTASTDASSIGANPMTSAYGLAQNQQSIDKYIEINVSNNMNASSGNISWVIITLYYSDVDLDKNGDGDANNPGDINENSLRLWWHCPNCSSASRWRVLETGNNYTSVDGPYVYGASVDTANNYVWANISHLSVYGIGGTVIPTPPPTPPTEGGEGVTPAPTEAPEEVEEVVEEEEEEIPTEEVPEEIPTEEVTPEVPVEEAPEEAPPEVPPAPTPIPLGLSLLALVIILVILTTILYKIKKKKQLKEIEGIKK